MKDDKRPDPDELLRRLQAEEERTARAILKIFFGYAPGVGKTYAMLESARRLKAQGIDVVAGVVETHGRPETAELLAGLEVLPRRTVEYRGVALTEFDLDRALARRPQILLLDELAHTNAPGSRHRKRWQDALELLDAGIEVHSTLNIQHIESLNDVVSQITFIRVRETVPDSILERADEIELVDISPDELLERLREGKVYIPEQAQAAVEHFFRRGNLLALRELILRRTAERLDADVRAYRREHAIGATWPAAERILVCVGPSPTSARLIRGARRMAAGLRAPWIAVHVEAGDAHPATPQDRERLQAHLRLAESLGGEVARLSGQHVSDEILRYAREHNVTRIIIGKPTHGRWRDILRGSLVNRLVRGSGDIEIHFISGDEHAAPMEPRPRPQARKLNLVGPALALLLVAAATALGVVARSQLSQPDLVVIFLLIIMFIAFRRGRAAALTAAVLSVAAYDFFFVEPFYTFNVAQVRHLLTFAMMFVAGLVMSGLSNRLRRQESEARARENRTAALYSLTRGLTMALNAQAAAAIAAEHAAEVFGGEAAVVLREGNEVVIGGRSRPYVSLSDEEMSVAHWVADHGRPAGQGTDTLPGVPITCVPIKAAGDAIGVLAVRDPSQEMLEVEQRGFLDAFIHQVALAIERARLIEDAKSAALRARDEETRSAVLSSVSHDLRTPLAAIIGAGTTLRDDSGRLDSSQHGELVDTICTEAERMERLISDILDMVRLESGTIAPRREWVPLEEVVGSALSRLEKKLGKRDVRVDLPEDLPLISVDPVLFEQVFVNLVDNANKYAPPNTPIEISAGVSDREWEIAVEDHGPGIAPGDETRVFERFYRNPRARVGGIGLGLPICRGIVQAHGGSITAENRAGGGARFVIRLPRWEAPPALASAGSMDAGADHGQMRQSDSPAKRDIKSDAEPQR